MSSYSAYESRLTIFVIQLSIYAICILEDKILKNEISSPRPGQRRSTAPFCRGANHRIVLAWPAPKNLTLISRVRGGTALESHTASLLREPDIISMCGLRSLSAPAWFVPRHGPKRGSRIQRLTNDMLRPFRRASLSVVWSSAHPLLSECCLKQHLSGFQSFKAHLR